MRRRKDRVPNDVLDRAVAAIRADAPEPAVAARAAQRVWARLTRAEEEQPSAAGSAATLRDCDGFRSLIPYYLSRSLTRSRMLLLDDHLRDCLACRKTLQRARREADPDSSVVLPEPSAWRSGAKVWKWALAALLIVGIGLGAWKVFNEIPLRSGPLATVEASEGGLFRVMRDVSSALAEGLQIKAFEAVRTAKDAGSLIRLSDGSLIEMRERTELSLSRSRRGTTIHLARGSVIVHAAAQDAGRLFVESGDALVSVEGTIFSVNRGTKGSRVSVIEGEVQVVHGRAEDTLLPGDQLSTHPSMGPVPVEEEIAWSRDLERHLEILRELRRLQQEVEKALTAPGLRHETRLLDALPRDTVIFASIPNIGVNLGQAHELFMEGIEQNPVLRDWWQQADAAWLEPTLKAAIDRVRLFGEILGDEIVVALALDGSGSADMPVVVAELTRRDELEGVLDQIRGDIAAIGEGPELKIIDDPWTASPTGQLEAINFWVHEDLLVASPDIAEIRAVASALDGRGETFRGTAFHRHLANVYDDGVEWLLGVELAPILSAIPDATPESRQAMARSGINDLEYLIFERRSEEGVTHHKARLSFDNPRRGVASWLAAPAPMGTLDFISPDAYMVAAFVMKEPAAVVGELLDMAGPELRRELEAFQQREQVDLVRDFAEPLGGEFAVALDGPILPVPAVKVAIEVYDPERLQESLEWAVQRLDRALGEAGIPGVTLSQRDQAGLTVYTLHLEKPGIDIDYAYVDGYLIAAPGWVLLEQSIQRREAGHVLRHSGRFRELLPRDTQVNFSAVFYQDLGFLWGPLAGLVSGSGLLGEDQQRSLDALTAEADASLVYAYAEEDEILFASAAQGGLFGADLGTLASLGTAGGIQQVLSSAIAGKRYHEGALPGVP